MENILCSLLRNVGVEIGTEKIVENMSCKYHGIASVKIARDNWKRISINLQRADLNKGLNTDEGKLRQFVEFRDTSILVVFVKSVASTPVGCKKSSVLISSYTLFILYKKIIARMHIFIALYNN